MITTIFGFIKNLFRYNRDVYEEFEGIWDDLTGGKASDSMENRSKKGNGFVNFILYLGELVLTFLPWYLIGVLGHGGENFIAVVILLLIPLLLTTIAYFVARYSHKSKIFKLIIGVAVPLAIGIIFGLLLLPF